MEKHMDATLTSPRAPGTQRTGCCAIASRSERAEGRMPARLRLEQAIGPELDPPARHEPDRPQRRTTSPLADRN